MSSITKCLNTSTICRKVARCDKNLCVVLIEAYIFNKAVQGNMPKPLRNLYIKFDVNTLRHCGEMACVEEYLHTFGNSDITMFRNEYVLCMQQPNAQMAHACTHKTRVKCIITGPYITFLIWGAIALAEVENMAVLQLFTLGGSGASLSEPSLVPRPLIRKNGLATYPGSNCIRM